MIIHDKYQKAYTLREVQISDAAALIDFMSIVLTETQNLAREPEEWTMTVDQESAFLERMIESDHDYMAVIYDQDILLAVASFHGSAFKRMQHRVTLGISMLQEYHNRGLGFVLMNHLLDQAKEMKKKTVDLQVRSDNRNAIHLYKKVGFTEEGVKTNGLYINGQYIDEILMAKHI